MGGKTLTRADLAEAVVEKVGLPRNESQDLVERVLEEISGSLAEGQTVKLSSFGSFGIRQKGQRIRHSLQGRAHRPQSQDRQGSAHHAAPRAGVPPVQHHEGPHQ